jgi:hypothetical protein
MVFKLVEAASRKFKKITNAGLLADVCAGKRFVDGMPEVVKGKK